MCTYLKIPWRRDKLPTPVFLGFPDGSEGKESAYNAGDLGFLFKRKIGTSLVVQWLKIHLAMQGM